MSVDPCSSNQAQRVSILGHFITGCATSVCCISLLHPLFTIKTLAMSRMPIHMKHLYAGYGANLMCDITNQGMAFCSFGFFENRVCSYKVRALTETEHFIGGLFAGTIASPLLSALERVMIIQQVKENDPTTGFKKVSSRSCIQEIIKHEGYRGLFKGVYPTIARESINSSCFFGLSKVFYKYLKPLSYDEKHATSYSYFLAGATAGFLTTPFDLIKTRIQKDITEKKRTIIQEIKTITDGRPHNIPKLYRGGLARVTMLSATMMGMGFFSDHIKTYLPDSLKDFAP